MRYLVFDYAEKEPVKKTKLFKKFKLYMQYRQFIPKHTELKCGETEMIYVNLSESTDQKENGYILKRVQKWLMEQGDYRILAAQKGLADCIPRDAEWTEDPDEVYIRLLRHYMDRLLVEGCISRKNARLLFVDDGTRDIRRYITELSGDWNYMTVCSERHDELEELYRRLYEEDGLMVSCLAFRPDANPQGDLVIDLTGSWKGIHRIYPPEAYVLDVTFSREKKEYLYIRHARIKAYVQVACGKLLTTKCL